MSRQYTGKRFIGKRRLTPYHWNTLRPEDLDGKFVVTNTTTDENIELLRERGVRQVLTITPRYEGRSFGTNLMEAVLTAYAGKGRPLSMAELNNLIDEIGLRPELQILAP